MKKKRDYKDVMFNIFSTGCILLSVYAFSLLGKLTGEPKVKLITDCLIIVLLVVLNTAVIALYEHIKNLRKK